MHTLRNAQRNGHLFFIEEPTDEPGGGTPDQETNDQPEREKEPHSRRDDTEDGNGAGSKNALKADLVRERRKRQALEKEISNMTSKLSELDAANQRVSELETELADLKHSVELSNARAEIAREKNVPSEWTDFITGTTKDEMSASAEKIISNLGGAQGPNLHTPKGKQSGSLAAGYELAKSNR